MQTSLLVVTFALAALLGGPGVSQVAARSSNLPPLIVTDDAPRLKGPPATASAKSKDKKSAADNSSCYICHVNLLEDSFALRHEEAGVGCVNCHGDSPAHVADEANLIPPEVMFPSDTITAACAKCHSTHNAPATSVIARWKERCAASAQSALCTDCHGKHRFAKRTIVWDKKTVKLLSASARDGATAGGSVAAAFGKALRGGKQVASRAEFRQRPLTVECWARLNSTKSFNILVASDTKASAEHWELYSFVGSGVLSLYQPGRGGNVSADVNICDRKWHYLAAIIEPERVRLFADGKLVKDAPATPLAGEPKPGDLAFGQLVEGGIGCDGAVDNVRISAGVRDISAMPAGPLTKDATTLGLWDFDDKPAASGKAPAATGLFARANLTAWCIVPFDAKKRGPEERAQMLETLGFKKFAYDWRPEHVSTFEAEILATKKHGVEFTAFWGMSEPMFKLFEKYNLKPQIWVMLPQTNMTQEAHVQFAVQCMLPVVERTKQLGCSLAFYNHGGWGGEPENLIAVVKLLRQQHGASHVGIVYNLHHGHDHLDRFPAALAAMKPYLLCLNLNGMTKDGDKHGMKILPLGQGDLDLQLLKTIRDSGYRGPIGILNHTGEDAEVRLKDNLDGLDWLVAQLDGKPAGPKPQPRSWRPPLPPQPN